MVNNKSSQQHLPRGANILTINVEDFFQVGVFENLIKQDRWDRFETRIHNHLEQVFKLLTQYDQRATFFIFGWIADRYPEIVQAIVEQGHEVASRGYWHRGINEIPRHEFRDDLLKTHAALTRAGAQNIIGYRSGLHSRSLSDLWILEILLDEGYHYDSSFLPALKPCSESHGEKSRAHCYQKGDKTIWEFPIPIINLPGINLCVGGGNYFRQLPFSFIRFAERHWHKKYSDPFVLYFHTWELDIDQPRICSASKLAKIRQYRNLEKMSFVLEHFFSSYRFQSCSDYVAGLKALPLKPFPLALQEKPVHKTSRIRPHQPCNSQQAWQPALPDVKKDITIVIPCYNEEITIPYLAKTLQSTIHQLSPAYNTVIIFVDDCSTDGTYNALIETFGGNDRYTIYRHEQNKGASAAIMTGILQADTEIVCSMDCDCTYDPHDCLQMLPLLDEQTDIVTASPYHPDGTVLNVRPWRLFLSRSASRLYSIVLPQHLYTFTSFFRVYRKSKVEQLTINNGGFLGLSEMLAVAMFSGLSIKEFPTCLESRIFGESKMKIARTISQHLAMLLSLLTLRLCNRKFLTNKKSLKILGASCLLVSLFLINRYDPSFLANDTAQYLSTSENFLQGKGFATSIIYYEENYRLNQVPAYQTVFPPGYPALISIFVWLRLSPQAAAFSCALLSYLASAIVLYFILSRIQGNSFVNFFLCAAWLLSTNCWLNILKGLSEMPFITCTLLSFFCYSVTFDRKNKRNLWLFLAGVLAAASFLIRYAGIFYAASLILGTVAITERSNIKQKLIDTLIAGSTPAIVIFLILYKNFTLTGDVKGGNPQIMNTSVSDVVLTFYYSLSRLTGLSIEGIEKGNYIELFLLFCFLCCITIFLKYFFLKKPGINHLKKNLQNPYIMFPLLYSLVTFFSLAYLEKTTSVGLSSRMLLPLVPFWFISGKAGFSQLPKKYIPATSFLFLLLFMLPQNAIWAAGYQNLQKHRENYYKMAMALDEKMINHQSINNFLEKNLSNQHPVFSYNPHQLSLLINKPILGIPASIYSSCRWDIKKVYSTSTRYNANYFIYFNNLINPQIENHNFWEDIATGKIPPWLTLFYSSEKLKIYRRTDRSGFES